jgi:class 3 adenylate cyclase
MRYVRPPLSSGVAAKYLVVATPPKLRFQFFDHLEVGRDEAGREPDPGQLLVIGAHVSWRHCVITQTHEGRCFVRDVSRNGTRLKGRRLLPNVESEFLIGETIDLGSGLEFVLDGETATAQTPRPGGRTSVAPQLTLATVLMGDIRDYTVLVRTAPAAALQQSVSRVFERLTAAVQDLGGTVKEFPGDAILAFWEGGVREDKALSACRAVIALDRLARQMADDRSIWSLGDFPVKMDWALATGPVVIDSFGGDTPMGLSMIGEPVVLACRLEKFANDQVGRILVCPATQQRAASGLRRGGGAPLQFADRGLMHAKGFEHPDRVFALQVPDS